MIEPGLVLLYCQCFEVIGVDTPSHPTKVVHFVAVKNGATMVLVGDAMGLFQAVAHSDAPVSLVTA